MSDDCSLTIRSACPDDAAALWQLVDSCPALDSNSFYCYWVICRHFTATSAVAERDGAIVGFLTSFINPADPDSLFLWQLYVAPDERGRGLAGRLLDHLAETLPPGTRFFELTIGPENTPSLRTIQSFARRLQADYEQRPGLETADFPAAAGDHHAEHLIRIGPLPERK